MTQLTYTKLLNETLEKYVESGVEEAYQFITQHADEIKGDHAQIYNFKYSLAAASGREEEALAIMKEAIIEKGHWYSYEYLKEDEDLNSLRKYDDFQYMLDLCKKREEEAKEKAKPEMDVMMPSANEEGHPLLIALHGNQENNRRTEENWHTAPSHGYVLAMPQSSQIEFSGGYSWDDIEKGTQELEAHYEELKQHGSINEGQLILGGFSAGARVALHTILKGDLPVKGFVFVGPWLPDIDELADNLEYLAEQGIEGYVICGDQDQDCLEDTNRFVEILKEKNVQHTYKVIEGLDHDYPENFNTILENALEDVINIK
ncbi:alpha/beta hydrolase [Pontibacillus sp. HMF3514]|uniref:alpha/beta hydrolase n=1 Tax=Pontibacillus sp. HMF3514 TaxID=2692425 RepID=UPI001320556C|nr:alpha/beta hydrolase [Pontibacillus sp. HMF3514]QHE52854.1 alpha/beta hydrolase [Pontibacillus sp. HMF3514]